MDLSIKRMMTNLRPSSSSVQNNIKSDIQILKSTCEKEKGEAILLPSPILLNTALIELSINAPSVDILIHTPLAMYGKSKYSKHLQCD